MINQSFVDNLKARLSDCESQLSAPGCAANQTKFRELVKEHSRLKKLIDKADQFLHLKTDAEDHRALLASTDADPELKQLAQEELLVLDQTLPAAERALMIEFLPPDPNDSRNAMIEIRAGTGGNEAALFAGDLLRMYSRYAEARGWVVEMIDASPSEVGGYKDVVISIQGDGAYRILRYEGGTHRVQRVPETEAQGRIHTSTATVAVLPEAEEVDEIEIKPDDLRVDVYRASGAGGQHVNKTDSAVRITHLPSGIVVASQEERSQHKNRAKAMRVLRSHLLALQRKQTEEKEGDARRSQIGSGDRSERIRTYNFPQNRLTDHRINYTAYNLERVVEGDVGDILQALYDHDINTRLSAGIALNQFQQA